MALPVMNRPCKNAYTLLNFLKIGVNHVVITATTGGSGS